MIRFLLAFLLLVSNVHADGVFTRTVNRTVAGSSSGSSGTTPPATPVNSIQFNNAGAFGGSNNLTWNGSVVSATAFKGDGSQLTGIAGSASPSWYAVTNIPTVIQNISNSTGSVTVTSINAVNGLFTTITPTILGINDALASNTQVLYVSGTGTGARADGALGISYNNVLNWTFFGTPTGITPPTPSATVHVSGSILASGNISGSTGTIQNLTVGSCTGCAAAGSGTPISTTTFTAASNISNSTAVGFRAAAGTGTDNTTYGSTSGNSLTTGSDNTGLGYLTIASATTTQFTTALGSQALSQCASCSNSTAVGAIALTKPSSQNNSAFGFSNMANLTTGTQNTGAGANSLGAETTGSFNTTAGYRSMTASTGASADTALGWRAGDALTTGSSNTLVGYSAGTGLTSGNSNIALGISATLSSATGSNQLSIGNIIYGDLGRPLAGNIGINVTSPTSNLQVSGSFAVNGSFSCTGSGCPSGGGGTSISTSTFTAATNISNSTAIGFNTPIGTGMRNTFYGANVASNNTLTTATDDVMIGYQAGRGITTMTSSIGIGTNALLSAATGDSNVVVGGSASNLNGGSNNSVLGASSGNNLSTGSDNLILGAFANAGTTGNNNIVIGNNSSVLANTASNQLSIANIIYGDTGRTLNGFIGVNMTSPTAAIEISGTVKMDSLLSSTGTNAMCWNSTSKVVSFGICTASDERLKQNIRAMDYGLSTVNAMQPRFYEFKDPAYGKGRQTGFIAQEMFKVVPEVVKTDSQGTWAVNYPLLVPVLVKALQEEDAKYQLLEARIEQLESQVNVQ